MKIVQLHNQQRSLFGGEYTMIANTQAVLQKHGHQAVTVMRSSRSIGGSLFRKAAAALNGIYSLSAISEMKRVIAAECPDIVHVHSVYPMWSPAIFRTCYQRGIPTVMHVHNHSFTCPNWHHLRNNRECERCCGGKEYWCALTNCRRSFPESATYALRSYVSRKLALFSDYVGAFIAVSEYLKLRLVAAGIPEGRVKVIPNVIFAEPVAPDCGSEDGEYIGYSGRVSTEKGVSTLLEAARRSGLPIRVAGDGPEREALERIAPGNVKFLGYLEPEALRRFYSGCRYLVVPSLASETFCMSAVEAMMKGKPVIASRIGAIPEIVEHGKTGLLFEPRNAVELSDLMLRLWRNPKQCQEYGDAARRVAMARCSEQVYYNGLLNAYRHAAAFTPCRSSAAERLRIPSNA